MRVRCFVRRILSSKSVVLGAFAACMATLAGPRVSHGVLGGFESADGYGPFLNRVQNYNAGQYGANSLNPSGTQTAITPNSGLWRRTSGTPNAGSYGTGHQFLDRTYVNSGGTLGSSSDQGLVLTTNHEGWTGPALAFEYDLDAADLGQNPLTTGNDVIDFSFWWCARLPGPEVGGQLADGYFGDEINFVDSSGNTGFTLGLTQRASGDKVTYWDGSTMVESAIIAAANRYDRWDISLDMLNNTFSADYFSFASSTLHSLVSNAPMQSSMADFARIDFRTSPGETNAKLFSVDDFTFQVRGDAAIPEPGTWQHTVLAAASLGMLMLMRRGAPSRVA